MNRALLLFTFITISTNLFSQKYCNGYVLYYPNDSVQVKIKNKGTQVSEIYKYEMGIEYKDSGDKRQIMKPDDCWGFVFFLETGDTLHFRVAKMYDKYIFARQMIRGKLSMLLYYIPEFNRVNLSYNPAKFGSGPMGYYSKESKAYFLSLDDYNYVKVGGLKFKKEDKEILKTLFINEPQFYAKLEQNAFYNGDIESITREYNLSH